MIETFVFVRNITSHIKYNLLVGEKTRPTGFKKRHMSCLSRSPSKIYYDKSAENGRESFFWREKVPDISSSTHFVGKKLVQTASKNVTCPVCPEVRLKYIMTNYLKIGGNVFFGGKKRQTFQVRPILWGKNSSKRLQKTSHVLSVPKYV